MATLGLSSEWRGHHQETRDKKPKETSMQATEIQTQARMLFEVHGPKAVVEASKKAKDCEHSGDMAGASDWRRIESALKLMQGPRET
jgi:hypothetical protein